MASVTGITAAAANAILGQSVVSALINGAGHLIMTRDNGSSFDAGDVGLVNSAEIAAHAALETGVHGLTVVGKRSFVQQAANLNLANSTTFQDTDLQIAVVNGAKYLVNASFGLIGTENTTGYKWQVNHPGGTWTDEIFDGASSSFPSFSRAPQPDPNGDGINDGRWGFVSGLYTCTANGFLEIEAAKHTLNAAALTFRSGGFLTVERVA